MDHSPYEFSTVVSGDLRELRVVVEAQAAEGTFRATRDAGLALNDSLAERGANFERFTRVRDVFLPPVEHARFALWHSVALAPGRLRAKVYLNPQISGPEDAPGRVKAALDSLGMPRAWSTIARAMPGRAVLGDEIRYFALDLDSTGEARVKVYLYLEDVSAPDLECIASLRPHYRRGEVTEFCKALARTSGRFGRHAPSLYLAFTGNDAVPSDVTVQLPTAHYAPNDEAARDRVRAYLVDRALDTEPFDRALDAATVRPLAAGRGLHTYVSLRTGSRPPRVTTYFAAEVYGAQAALRESVRPRADEGRAGSAENRYPSVVPG